MARSGPLTRRLVVLQVALAAAALAVAAVVAVVGLRSYLLDRTDDQLTTAAAVVRERLARQPAGDTDLSGLRAAAALGDLVVEVRDADGGLQRLGAPATGLPLGALVGAGRPDPTEVSGYRVVAVTADGRVVAVALPLDPVDRTVRRLALVETVTAAVVLGVLAVLARAAVGSALRPLARVTRAAQSVAAGDLDAALPVPVPSDRGESGLLVDAVHRMLARIRAALADSQAARSRLRDFLADASHELRTPLTTVRGYLQLVAGDPATAAAHREALQRADAEASRMSVLVEDLLTLSRLEARPEPGAPGDLAAVARAAVADALAVAPGRPLHLDVATGPHVVPLDVALARRVVDNLLENAGRHAGPDVAVRVRVDRTDDGVVRLRVQDAGPGVPAAIADRVFQRFVHGPRAGTVTGGGSGLGLAIVAEAAASAGGTVRLDSAPGSGTTVEVLLPAATAPSPAG